MDGAPVYFIGGSFGGASSGWLIAVLAAGLAAFGTFVVGRLIEDYKRHRDRQALAAAFRSDIRVWLQLNDELQLEATYRTVLDMLMAGRDVPGVPVDALTFPPTIYEKSADRVGILGQQEAEGVVRFYNFANGFRTGIRLALSDAYPSANRAASLTALLKAWPGERQAAERLLVKLDTVANRPWRLFM